MSKTKKMCHCGKPSLPGLSGEHPPCQYHWNEANWGKAWADRMRACASEPLAWREAEARGENPIDYMGGSSLKGGQFGS